MCTVHDSDGSELKTERPICLDRSCMKCENKAILITRMNDAFCRTCFLVYVVHKFRAAIGKSKLIRDGERVLVAFSGGPCSTSLLHLVQQGLGENVFKKLRFKPSILFIDEGAALGQSQEERLQICDQVQSALRDAGFPCYMSSLEMVMNVGTSDTRQMDKSRDFGTEQRTNPLESSNRTMLFTLDESFTPRKLSSHEQAEVKLRDLLDSTKSVTDKESLIRMLRHQLLLESASQLGQSKVMCGDTATRLATKLLSGIAQGRGGHIPFDTGFSDTRNADIMFVRPMKDFSAKEVAMYNRINKLEPVFIPTLTTKSVPVVSIERLTEEFVSGLQADYAATVSNITRTGEKLDHVVKEGSAQKQPCALCQAPLDTDVGATSALHAVLFSQSLSQGTAQSRPDSTHSPVPAASVDSHTSGGSELSEDDVLVALCYGCRVIIKDNRLDVNKLPPLVIKDIYREKQRSSMKEEIKEFLLTDI